jgi:AcrR family transcriptional regulator
MNGEEFRLPPLAAVLWGRDDGRRPGPKPGLDLQRIGAAAVELADVGGIAAVSMAKVAAALGVSTMALYRYVSGKQELVDLMLNEVYDPAPPPFPADSGWQQRLRIWAGALRDVLVKHRWVMEIPITEPAVTPSQVYWTELGLSAFAGTPLNAQDKLSALLLTDNYVRGMTQLSIDPTADATGADAGERYARGLALLAATEDLPEIAAAISGGGFDDEPGEQDFSQQEFAFGLDTLIAGIQVRLAARRRPQDGADHPS